MHPLTDSHDVQFFYLRTAPTVYELAKPVLSSFNSVTIREPYVYTRHQHLNYQIILVEVGCYRCTVNDQPLVLGPDEILIVKPGDWHEDDCRPPLRYCSVNFDLKGTEKEKSLDILFHSAITAEEQVLRSKQAEIWQVVRSMRDEALQTDDMTPKIQNALLLEFFWRLIRALPKDRIAARFLSQTEAHAFLVRLVQVFDAHRTDWPSVEMMAREMGTSARTLTQRCRTVLGQSPAHAYVAHKIRYAASLLGQSKMPVKEISHLLGFQNPYHFSRVFKRFHGVSPSSLRPSPE